MKIILSRKGFDSTYGGVASPILPDGQLLSLPIPYKNHRSTYGTVLFNGKPISNIVQSLTKNKFGNPHSCHLDPDLRIGSVTRRKGWRPIFGQVGSAQTHLENHDVGVGDLFLFFGWFKQTEYYGSQLIFSRGAKDQHVLYGWLQVGEKHKPYTGFLDKYPWAKGHPHCQHNNWKKNTVYFSASTLSLKGLKRKHPGAGVFPNYSSRLRLTAPGRTRSVWQLPSWMNPHGRGSYLSYHDDPNIWTNQGKHTLLESRARGQEFVLNTDHYPEAVDWVSELVEHAI